MKSQCFSSVMQSVALISLECPVASAERLNVDILSINNVYCYLFIDTVFNILIKIGKL